MNSLFSPSWVELAIAVPLVGSLFANRLRDAESAYRWSLGFTGAALACSVLAALSYSLGVGPSWGLLPRRFGTPFALDELSAPLLPLVALLHFLTALSTARTKMGRFPVAWMLFGDAVLLAIFACVEPWPMIGLMITSAVPRALELRRRGRPARVYLLHMGAFAILLVVGRLFAAGAPALGGVLLLGAVLVRSGTVPFHLWVADLCENGTFGNSLLFVAPLVGVYAAVRLVLPLAPDWALAGMGVLSLATALYAAGLATVQTDARRFFAYLFLSHASLILVGMESVGLGGREAVSLTGALALWLSVVLSLGGLGLTLRALEARLGRLSMAEYRGLYEQSPSLAVCFLLTGLASVGFPGTMGFLAAEMLLTGVVEANWLIGVVTVGVAAINGIAILRAYLLLFTGRRYAGAVSLAITGRERFAVLTLAALILLGGLAPQGNVESRYKAAEAILRQRSAIGAESHSGN